jgi:ankyrin repeat protein
MEQSLETLAWNSTAADFDDAVTARGLPSGAELDLLLLAALSNSHAEARFPIANFLLDHGAKTVAVSHSGSGALVLALSNRTHDLPRTVRLVQRLRDGGADPNQRGGRGQTPSHYLPNLNKFTDEQLRPLYDVWFDAPGLRFDIPNKAGLNAIELARNFPYRTEPVERMESYAAR